METKVAVLSVIVENSDSVEALNCILHTYGDYIIGRMGLPYRPKHINLISLAVDAQEEIINKLAENIEGLAGVSVKVVTSNI
ncbi:MAG: iron-only hydrogenase system regulator [Lachnospiraceae bacterium]|jgi:putative iron-only hydrogenase system regulator|nr:iron-only hydrogenase system regulator [Lachnospiraceae bacterium]